LRGNLGGTLLHHAAWLGRPALARRLLELGADVEPKDAEVATGGARRAPRSRTRDLTS
jgi:hypothetical protein